MKPPISPTMIEHEQACIDCGTTFKTCARVAKRCPACRGPAQKRSMKHASERRTSERNKRREQAL